MKTKLLKTPRKFSPCKGINLKDMGEVWLQKDEQLTFKTKSGRRNDVTKKSWGFYLSNSINSNLKKQGFKTALVVSYASKTPSLYVNLVEKEKVKEFQAYLDKFNVKLIAWLDEWSEEKSIF